MRKCYKTSGFIAFFMSKMHIDFFFGRWYIIRAHSMRVLFDGINELRKNFFKKFRKKVLTKA